MAPGVLTTNYLWTQYKKKYDFEFLYFNYCYSNYVQLISSDVYDLFLY